MSQQSVMSEALTPADTLHLGTSSSSPDSCSSSSSHRWPLRLKTLFTESECTDGASVNHISHTQLPSCLASDNKSAAPGCVCPFYHAHITPYPERERHFWPA